MLVWASRSAVFLAVFSQSIFLTSSGVVYANILSLPVVVPFLISVITKQKLTLNVVVLLYFALAIFWIFSLFWHSLSYELSVESFRTPFFVSVFLGMLYHLMVHERVAEAVRWAVYACLLVNFVVYLGGIQHPLIGNTYLGFRFQGTFENPNQAALVFFCAAAICFIDLERPGIGGRFVAFLCLLVAPVLILVTGSRKGIFLIAFLYTMMLPMYGAGLGAKRLFGIVLTIALVAVPVIQANEYIPSADLLEVAFQRWDSMVSYFMGTGARDGSVDERLYFIREGFGLFSNSPLYGHGYNYFSLKYGTYSHSNYIELLANGGLVAFSIYYYIYFYVLSRALNLGLLRQKVMIGAPIVALMAVEPALVSYQAKIILYVILVCSFCGEELQLNTRKNKRATVSIN